MTDLAAKRVLVTRARHQAGPLRDALIARGAMPIDFPVIEIQPLQSPETDVALRDLGGYDWVGFTSANGARIAIARWRELVDATWPPSVSVAAVGSATADVLRELGVPVHAVPDEFRGTALPEALGAPSGRRVLLLRADIAASNLANMLREVGAHVDDFPIYRTVPAIPGADAAAAVREGADAVTFTSPSTVRNFLAAAHTLTVPVSGLVVASIGPVTTGAARRAGLSVHVEAAPHTIPGLVDALAAYWRAAPVGGPGPRTAAH